MERGPGQLSRGFVWGQIYIVLAIVFGIIGLIYGIMGLVASTGPGAVQIPMSVGIWTVVFSGLMILSGVGVWGRWVWGLWLTYLIFSLQLIGVVSWLAMFLIASPLAEIPAGLIVGRVIAALIHILIICLWWGYFIRRRSWFK
jgi:hypothetical protein